MSALAVWWRMLAFDLGRYLVAASLVFAIVWLWLARALAARRIQPERPRRAQIWFELRHSLVTAAIFSSVGLVSYYGQRAGVLHFYGRVSRYGWGWWLASLALMALLHDTYFYWTHRLMHHRRLYRTFHLVHHRSTSPTPWAAYSFAPLEAVVEALIVPLIALVMPVHGLAVFVFLAYSIVRNVLGHCGYELMPRGFARGALGFHTTPTHHDLHHRHPSANFGLYFTFWDRLMGTTHARYHETFDRVTGRDVGSAGARPAAPGATIAG